MFPSFRLVLFLIIVTVVVQFLVLIFGTSSQKPFLSVIPEVKMIPTPPFNTSRVAAIIETRALATLIPLIVHFSGVLGDDWPFHIFHSAENKDLLLQSGIIQKHIESGRFKLTELSNDVVFRSRADVSNFLTKRWIWDSLTPAEDILFFQSDSIICANSPFRIEDFLGYDMVGALWTPTWGANGGLSIRRRSKMLQVIEKIPFTRRPGEEEEDLYFYRQLANLPSHNLPPTNVSAVFSVEGQWHDHPFGYHQAFRYHSQRSSDIKKWCPEIELAITMYI